jgi:hypothetical protein
MTTNHGRLKRAALEAIKAFPWDRFGLDDMEDLASYDWAEALATTLVEAITAAQQEQA